MTPKARMNNLHGRVPHFRVSVRSVLAAFLLVGCIQAAIVGMRGPIAALVGWFGNLLAGKFHTDIAVFHRPPDWGNLAANMAISLLFFAAFVWVAWRTGKKTNAEAG